LIAEKVYNGYFFYCPAEILFFCIFFIKYRKINRLQKFLPYLVPHIQLPRKKDPFFAPDKSYDFFYHQARKIFFFKKLTMFVSFPEAIQKKDR